MPAPRTVSRARSRIATAIGAYAAELAEAGEFSGAVALSRRGATVLSRRWGRTLRGADACFDLGSLNKMFTAVAVCQLVERERVSLQDPLGRWFPAWPHRRAAAEITVHMLLTHTSGLGDLWTDAYERAKPRIRHVADFLPIFASRRLAFSPGSQFGYSSAGFTVLGRIVELASGREYADYMRRHVYGPAGMKNTRDVLLPAGPAGGGASTAADLIKFGRALVAGELVEKATFAMMARPQAPFRRPWDPAAAYGYGFAVTEARGRTFVGHRGNAAHLNTRFEIATGGAWWTIAVLSRQGGAADRVTARFRELLARAPG